MPDRYDEMCDIAECEHCDDHGLRPMGHKCDHIDYAAIAKRGIKKCLEAMEKKE